MQVKTFKIRDFSGGEATNPDAGDQAGNTALEARNVDTTQFPGCLYKTTGATIYEFDGKLLDGLLPAGEEILSVGAMVYNKVWDGSVKVNRPTELVIVQVKDAAHDFSWYELERAVGSEEWTLSPPSAPPYYMGWDHDSPFAAECWGSPTTPIMEYLFGVSNAHSQRARWLSDRGVLRAALGNHLCESLDSSHPMFNKADSFPLQWRYVNRMPIDPAVDDVNGYFKDFDLNSTDYGKCVLGFEGLTRSIGFPDYTPPALILVQNETTPPTTRKTWQCWNDMGYQSAFIKYVLLAEYDGHQIGDLKRDPETIAEIVTTLSYYTWVTKLSITITGLDPLETLFPRRLSGFRLYRSYQNLGVQTAGQVVSKAETYPSYDEIARFDIRDGLTNVWNVDAICNTTYQFMFEHHTAENQVIDDDLLKDLFLRFTDDNGDVKEYPITSMTTPDPGWVKFNFNPTVTPSLTIGNHYIVTINSRWYRHNLPWDYVKINFIDFNMTRGSAPPWIDPNTERTELPRIDCNYSQARIFKDQMWVSGVAYDDEKKPLMLRSSNPVNNPLAGFDIQPNYLIPAADEDDEIICVRPYLDFLLVGTKRKLFKYLLSGGQMEVLAEMPWDTGVNAIDAYIEVDAVSYFVGRRGDRKILYVWIPDRKPIALDKVRKEVEDILNAPDINLALTQAIPLLRDDKVLFSIPTGQEDAATYAASWNKINDINANGLLSVGGNYVTQKTLGILPVDVGTEPNNYPAGTIIIGVVDNDPTRVTHTRKFYAQKPNETTFSLVYTWPGLGGEGSKDPTMSFVIADNGTIHAVTTWQNVAQASNIVYYKYFTLDGGAGVNTPIDPLDDYGDNHSYPDIAIDPMGNNRLVIVFNSYRTSTSAYYVNKVISSNTGVSWAADTRTVIADGEYAPSVCFTGTPQMIYAHYCPTGTTSKLVYGLFGDTFSRLTVLESAVNMPNACMCFYEQRLGFLDVDADQNLNFRYWADGAMSDAEVVAADVDNANNYALTYQGSDADRKWVAFWQTTSSMMMRTRPIDSTTWDDPVALSGESLYPTNATFDHFGTLNSRRPPVANADHANVWAINSTANGSGDHYDFWYRSANVGPTILYCANLEIDKNNAVMLRGDGAFGKMSTVLAVKGWTRLSDDSILYHNNTTFYRFDPTVFTYADNPITMYWRQQIPGGQRERFKLYAIRPVFEYLDTSTADGFTITVENENGFGKTVSIAATDSGKQKFVNIDGREFIWTLSHTDASAVKFRELEVEAWMDRLLK